MATTTASPLQSVKWDDVLDTLEAQRCVLFSGTTIFTQLKQMPLARERRFF